jgi:hypothetical protein
VGGTQEAEAEIRRRVNLIDDWISFVGPFEKPDLDDIDNHVD